MRKRYRYTFEFKNTIEEAKRFCDSINNSMTYYMRKNHPAHFTPWSSQDGTKNLFVCWYYY